MIEKIDKNISQLSFNEFGSCVYLIKLENKNILIDTSSKENSKELLLDLKQLNLKPEDINVVILTHNHWDHVGNCKSFTNAKFYASKKDFEKIFFDINDLKINEFRIIHTPGHSKGSICILYNDILFSGDTIFHNGIIGRTDLPRSSETEMQKSLEKLKLIKFKILCPGHI